MGFCIYEMLNMHFIILLVAFRLLQINVIWASNVRIFAIILFLMFCCCSLESSKKAVQSLYFCPNSPKRVYYFSFLRGPLSLALYGPVV